MILRHRAVAGLLLAALGCAAPAIADPTPPPPAPPAPAELIPAIGSVLAQAGEQPAGPLGLPDLSAYPTNLLLGQTAVPALPGVPAAAVRAVNPAYLLSQNAVPAAPGEGAPAAGLAPNADIDGTGRIAFLRRIYQMYQSGGLTGALLGQQPADRFGVAPHA